MRQNSTPMEEIERANSFLGHLFGRIGGDHLFYSNPVFIESVSRLLGSYSSWFSAYPSCLEGTLSYLLRAMQVPSALRQASNAFKSICIRSMRHIRSAPILERLIEAAEAAMPKSTENYLSHGKPPPQFLEERTAVIEGLARVTATLPPETVMNVTARLATPLIVWTQKLAEKGTEVVSLSHSSSLSTQLQLVAVAIRFLDITDVTETWEEKKYVGICSTGEGFSGNQTAPGGENPKNRRQPGMVLVEMVWPVLSELVSSPKWRSDREVMTSVCSVYIRSLLLAKTEGSSLVSSLIPSLFPLVSVFEQYQHAASLEVWATAMETVGHDGNCDVSVFTGVLNASCHTTFALLQRGELFVHPEVAQSLFKMAYKYLFFQPELILSSSALPGLVEASAAVLRNQERESSKITLVFLGHMLSLQSPALLKNKNFVDACMQQYGETLMMGLLFASSDKLPRDLVRSLGSVLYSLIDRYRNFASVWLIRILGDPSFPGISCGALGDSEKKLVCDLMLKSPPLLRPRFEAMVADFVALCRREGTSDALVAYQL